MKTIATREDETLRYISTVCADLRRDVEAVMQRNQGKRRELLKSLSIPRNVRKMDGSSKPQRDALRSLLMCQQMYLQKIELGGVSTEFVDRSLPFWRDRTEGEIREAISAYALVKPTPRRTALLEVAQAIVAKAGRRDIITATRGNLECTSKTCYEAVAWWLFHAGFVGLQFCMRVILNDKRFPEFFGSAEDLNVDWQNFTSIQGIGDLIEAYEKNPTAGGSVADIAKIYAIKPGTIIYLTNDNPRRFRGHWMVSAGDGEAYGTNNMPIYEKLKSGLQIEANNGYDKVNVAYQVSGYCEDLASSPKNWNVRIRLFNPRNIPYRTI